MTTVMSWTTMLAVMYGMIPSAKTENRDSAPPENRLRNCSTFAAPWLLMALLMSSALTPGSGTYVPKR